MRRIVPALVLTATAMMGMAACGDDETTSSTSQGTTTTTTTTNGTGGSGAQGGDGGSGAQGGMGGAGQGGMGQGGQGGANCTDGGATYLQACTDNNDCVCGICHNFMMQGVTVCTIQCASNADCPAPSAGCNGMGICRPPP